MAFDQRFCTYIIPNRTLSSYLPGKKKLTYDNILVRGYWGDIMISPYIAFGVDCDVSPEKDDLFKKINMQYVFKKISYILGIEFIWNNRV